jgi:hypothetical protein
MRVGDYQRQKNNVELEAPAHAMPPPRLSPPVHVNPDFFPAVHNPVFPIGLLERH